MSKFNDLGSKIVENIGGSGNIISLTHCITRLRFTLRDTSLFNIEALNLLPGVIMAVNSNEQCQVVIGNDVTKVYDAIYASGSVSSSDFSEEEPLNKGNIIGAIFNKMSSILVPVVPALAGAGMIKALLVILTTYHLLAIDSSTYKILAAASNSVFYFLPLFLAFSCGRSFGTNPFVSVAIVGALLEPNFSGLMKAPGDIVTFIGIPVVLMKYTSTLIPAILSIWLYSYVERLLKKTIHQSIESVAVPMLGLLIMVPATAIVIGPIGVYLGDGIGHGISYLTGVSGMLTGALIGGGWTLLVMFGLHWGLVPVMINNIAIHGSDTIKPAAAMATFAQGGVALGVFLKAKDKKLKSFALSAMIPALFAGVTEPVVYGLSVKYKRPLIASIIAGTVAGGFVGAMGTTVIAYVFPSITTLPAFMTNTFAFYLIGLSLSFVLSAALTYAFGFDEGSDSEKATDKRSHPLPEEPVNASKTVMDMTLPENFLMSPLIGKVIPLEKVNDPVFSTESVGKGLAIVPEEGFVYSPVNGEITRLFHTRHAVCITSDDGAEIIIHIGLDTVRLDGKYFAAFVKEGDRVQIGQLLLSFDIEGIRAEGYDLTTPVVVANTCDYQNIIPTKEQTVRSGTHLLTLQPV